MQFGEVFSARRGGKGEKSKSKCGMFGKQQQQPRLTHIKTNTVVHCEKYSDFAYIRRTVSVR